MENSLQCAVITPFAEAAVDRLPGTIAFRQVAPGSPTLCNPQDCMKNHTLIFRGGIQSSPLERDALLDSTGNRLFHNA